MNELIRDFYFPRYDYDGYLESAVETLRSGDTAETSYLSTAVFYNELTTPYVIDTLSVSLNDTALSDGYQVIDTKAQEPFPGVHHWVSLGGDGVPAFSATIDAPARARILSPSTTDSINPMKPLEIRYDATGIDSIRLGALFYFDTRKPGDTIVVSFAQDTSFSSPASGVAVLRLNAVPPFAFHGGVIINLMALREVATSAGNKRYLLRSGSVDEVIATVKLK